MTPHLLEGRLSKTFIKLMTTAIFVLVFSQHSIGQCSISKDETTDMYILSTKSEQLFRNEDLENGLKTVYGSSMLVANKVDKDKVKFSMIVTYFKTSHQPSIVPRSISFSFSNGGTLTVPADEYETPVLNGVKGERCYFRISIPDMEKINASPVRSFTITDTRTGESLRMTPYNAIFQEQIGCLLKRYDEL